MIEKISIAAADIDLTLIEKGQNLKPITRAALERLHKEGVKFGVASGRPFDHRMLDRAEEWGLSFPLDFAIGLNGGDLYDASTGEVEHFYRLPKETVREILTFLAPLDVNSIVYENGYDVVLATRMDGFMQASIERNHSTVIIGDIDRLSRYDTGKIEVHYTPEVEPLVEAAIKANQSEDWIAVHTFIGTVEFMHPQLNKGTAVRRYAELHHVPMSEVAGFGDEENDLGLIKEAGWGVCLSNGCDACKEAAQAVTEYSVYEDGFGKYLYDHYFKAPYEYKEI